MATTIFAKSASIGSSVISTANRLQSIVSNNLLAVTVASGIISVVACFLDADALMYAAGMVTVALSTKAAGKGGES